MEQQSYRSDHSKYPVPEIYFSDADKLCILAVPWGDRSLATKAIELIKEYFLSSLNDAEATTPFPLKRNMSMVANRLRIACMITNEVLLRENNGEEWTGGVEIAAATLEQNELVIMSYGGPSLFYRKGNTAPWALQFSHLNLAAEFSKPDLAPLPKYLLGIQRDVDPEVRSMRWDKKDEFLWVQRNYLPTKTPHKDLKTLKDFGTFFVEENKDSAFWLGQWKF